MPRGGARPGAGRPALAVTDQRNDKAIARELKTQLRLAFGALTDSYASLLNKAIGMAQEGDRQMMRLLLTLPFQTGFVNEREETAFDAIREKWSYERTGPTAGPGPEEPDSGAPIGAESRVV